MTAEERALLQKKAEMGDANAQTLMGIMYYNGHGVTIDYSKAADWFTKAADKGDAQAQYLLAAMYGKGQGVQKDFSKADELMRKAAAQGYEDARRFLNR